MLAAGYAGLTGQPIALDASGTVHPDGALVKYEWDFNGDGTFDLTTDSPTATYTYTSDYIGNLTLRVTDEAGRWSATTASVVMTRDGDAVDASEDNCPDHYSPDQSDQDNDGLGDACDPTGFPTENEPGVTVIDWDGTDPDGDSYVDSVTTFTTPNWNIEGHIYGPEDQDAYGLEWGGGEIQLQIMGFATDLDLYLTDVYGNDLHQAITAGPRSEKLRLALPAGRYVMHVVPGDTKGDPTGKYRVKATAITGTEEPE